MSLDSHAELERLARELEVDPADLAGLHDVGTDGLRRLRHLVSNALHDEHHQAFQRAAQASVLLPVALTAKLSETLIGPYLSSRIAAEMAPDRSIRLARHLSTGFLADVCLSLDPSRVADTVRGLPDDRVVAVGLELLRRKEYVTLGKFVDVVNHSVLAAMAAEVTTGPALVGIAFAIEAHHRLDDLIGLLDDDRLDLLVATALERDQLLTALALMSHLSPDNRRRAINVDAMARPDVLRDVVAAADAEDLWPVVLPLVALLDDDRLEVLAGLDDLLTPELVARLATAAALDPDLWEPLVHTMGRVPPERQVALAEVIVETDGLDPNALLSLVALAPDAADLPGVAALRERLA